MASGRLLPVPGDGIDAAAAVGVSWRYPARRFPDEER